LLRILVIFIITNIDRKTLKIEYYNVLGQETVTPKANILLKHLKPKDLSCRGGPLQTFNNQSSATGAPSTRLGIVAHHSPERIVVN